MIKFPVCLIFFKFQEAPSMKNADQSNRKLLLIISHDDTESDSSVNACTCIELKELNNQNVMW